MPLYLSNIFSYHFHILSIWRSCLCLYIICSTHIPTATFLLEPGSLGIPTLHHTLHLVHITAFARESLSWTSQGLRNAKSVPDGERTVCITPSHTQHFGLIQEDIEIGNDASLFLPALLICCNGPIVSRTAGEVQLLMEIKTENKQAKPQKERCGSPKDLLFSIYLGPNQPV